MARFKKVAKRRSFFAKVRRSSTIRGGALNTLGIVGGSMAYGAVREKVSNWLTPITSKVPLGNISDEIVLGGLSWLAYKKIPNKLVRSIALGGLVVESARVGEAIANGSVMGSSSSASGNSYTYG